MPETPRRVDRWFLVTNVLLIGIRAALDGSLVSGVLLAVGGLLVLLVSGAEAVTWLRRRRGAASRGDTSR